MGKAERRIAELEARVARLEDEAERAGQAEFAAECKRVREYTTTAPDVIDNEADFQDFLRAYDMPRRLIRLLRLAYLVGVGDAQTPEM